MSDMERREELEENLQLLLESDPSSGQIALGRVKRMLNEAGSIAYCREMTNEYIEKSIASLAPLKDTDSKSYLVQMAQSLIS